MMENLLIPNLNKSMVGAWKRRFDHNCNIIVTCLTKCLSYLHTNWKFN